MVLHRVTSRFTGVGPPRGARKIDLVLNSIMTEVKKNLGSSDHAFPEQYKDYPPKTLEEEDHRWVPGGFDTRREIRRDDKLSGKEVNQSEGEKDSQNTHDLIRRYPGVAAIVSPQRFR